MNGIVLFLILHIFSGTKDTNSEEKDTEPNGYLYMLAQYAICEELVSLSVVYMCRIRNRTIPFIVQKLAVQGVGPINIFGSKGLK